MRVAMPQSAACLMFKPNGDCMEPTGGSLPTLHSHPTAHILDMSGRKLRVERIADKQLREVRRRC